MEYNNDLKNDLTEEEAKWFAKAVLGIFFNKNESLGGVGQKKITLLLWLLKNRDNIPHAYRGIGKASHISLAIVYRTITALIELGLLHREEGDPNVDVPVYTVLFN